jgi:hypothetical protein
LAEKAGLSMQTLNDIEGCRRWVSSKNIDAQFEQAIETGNFK